MDFVKISEEKLLAARTYMPLGKKMEFVSRAAAECLDRVSIRLKDGSVIEHTKEATDRKSRWLMGALAEYYLKTAFEPVEGTDYLMAQDDYDRWAGGHIFNQLERFKSSAKTRDRAFDLLWDYRDLEKRLNTEIYNLLQAMNDPIVKLGEKLAQMATPEAVQEAAKELTDLKEQFEALQEKAGESHG